jgi:hypothetical protein
MSYQMLIDPYSSTQVKQKSAKRVLDDGSINIQFENTRIEDDLNNMVEKNESLPIVDINQSYKKGIKFKYFSIFFILILTSI